MAGSNFDQPMMGRRAFIGGAMAASALAALAACGKKGGEASGSASSGSTSSSGGTLRYYINNPVSIDPYNGQETEGVRVIYQLFDSLTLYDYQKEKLVPLAAEKWESNDDATEFTFTLKDAKFHNGDPVTSKDFKRAFERIVNPNSAVAKKYTPSVIAYHLSTVEGYDELSAGSADELTGVTCPDDKTLVIKLTSPYADFPYVMSHPSLAPVPEAGDKDVDSYYLAPIGNGPFKIKDGTKWEDGSSIDLVRNDDYYGEDKPKIAAVHFAIQKDVATGYREFQAGNLDFARVPVAEIESAKKKYKVSEDGYTATPDGNILLGSQQATYFYVCNMKAAPFDNVKVRQAASLAINRDNVSDVVFHGTRKSADSVIPPSIHGYEKGAWPYSHYDKEAAEKLLDEAGYPRDSSGSRGLKIKVTYDAAANMEVLESIMQDLNEVGFDCEADTAEWKAVLSQYTDHNFQLGSLGWTADYPIMDNFLYPLFHSDSLEGDNHSGYSNPEVDAAIKEARTMTDEDARLKKQQEIVKIIGEDCPVIPINYYSHDYIASPDTVKSLYLSPAVNPDLSTAEMA